MLPSRSWGQRIRLSLSSHSLASNEDERQSHPTAQQASAQVTRGPLHKPPVSPWTLGSLPSSAAPHFVQGRPLLLPLHSAPRCCCSSIFPGRLLCNKHQPRNPGISSLYQKKPQFKYPCYYTVINLTKSCKFLSISRTQVSLLDSSILSDVAVKAKKLRQKNRGHIILPSGQ